MSTASAAIDAPRSSVKALVARMLSPIADIHEDEVLSALLLAVTMFLLLGGYYLLKTARESFILSEGGAEVKSYSSAGQALVLLVLVPAYGRFAARVNRIQLVQWVTLFFASNLVLFLLAIGAGMRVGIAFFLWTGIFNTMVIAQFWGYAADVYTQEQGKRIFPLIGVGASLGAWLGAVRAGQLMTSFGSQRLLISGAIILVVCIVLARIADRVTVRGVKGEQAVQEKLKDGPSGFTMLLRDRYLTLMALFVLLLNVVNTSGEYLFGRYVVQAANDTLGSGPASEAARETFIGETYSSYFGYVNLIGFLLQMFVVSRLFKWAGVARAVFIHPAVALVGYVGMLFGPSFGFVRWLKIADNSLDYSIGNTTRQALWLPTSREAKYKAKQAVDSFCMRAGDVLQAGVVYTGELVSLGVHGFAAVNVLCALGWLGGASGLSRGLRRHESDAGEQAL
jgi:AAA family ATP:ADP antiporter